MEDEDVKRWCECRECKAALDQAAQSAIAWRCMEHGIQEATVVDLMIRRIQIARDRREAGRDTG